MGRNSSDARRPNSGRAEWLLALILICLAAGITATGYVYDPGEASAPLRERLWQVVGVVAAALFVAVAGIVALGRHHRVRAYRERSEAAEALSQSEAQMSAMFDLASVGIAQADPRTGRFLAVNRKMCAITGYGTDELLGMRIAEVTHPDDRQADSEAARRVVQGEQPDYRMEKRYVRKDGTVAWVNVNMTVIRDAAGEPTRTAATIEDITERRQARESLLASEGRYRRLFEAARDGILILDAKTGMTLDVNPFLVELLGFTREQFLAQRIWELGPFEEIFANEDAFRQFLEEGYVRVEDKPLKRADGRRIAVEFASNVYQVDLQTVIQCNVRDISKRRRAEEARDKLQAQLVQAGKMEAVGSLAGGVAHDFNNMLTVVKGCAEMAMEKLPPIEPARVEVAEILAAAERSEALVRQLLAFARKQTIAPKILDLNDAVAPMLSMLRRLIGEDVELVWKPGADLGSVKMDPSQIGQLLANLVINARDAVAGVGRVTIETAAATVDETECAFRPYFVPGTYVVLRVSDDGCGMDAEVQAQIFEPFFSTKPRGRGTGLGLATVYGIVKQNGGFINVYSEPGHGATFALYLPAHAPKASMVTADPRESEPPRAPSGPKTVLLVEDDVALLALSRRMLEHLGYTVLAAGGPIEATELLKAFPGEIHLLMTDVVMPKMNGRELQVALDALRPGLKCLFTSGYTSDIIADRGVLDEGIQFLQKPFTQVTLAEKVREAIG